MCISPQDLGYPDSPYCNVVCITVQDQTPMQYSIATPSAKHINRIAGCHKWLEQSSGRWAVEYSRLTKCANYKFLRGVRLNLHALGCAAAAAAVLSSLPVLGIAPLIMLRGISGIGSCKLFNHPLTHIQSCVCFARLLFVLIAIPGHNAGPCFSRRCTSKPKGCSRLCSPIGMFNHAEKVPNPLSRANRFVHLAQGRMQIHRSVCWLCRASAIARSTPLEILRVM